LISQKRRIRPWSAIHHATPEHQAFAGELRSLLESSIDELPDGLREVFMLREVEGLNTAETAESLGVSEDVVKTRLSRSRAALRNVLGASRRNPGARRLPLPAAAMRPDRRGRFARIA
jgi:RNA polymerase sigma factor (sigma-70 family)